MKSLSIEFTSDCNYRCPWCINAEILKGNSGPIPPSEFERIIEHIRSNSYDAFCFCGGEPLCWPNELREAMAIIRELRPTARIAIATNGTGVTKEISDFFIAHNISVLLSVEAKGYKDLSMLVRNAVEPGFVFENLRQIPELHIRSVLGDLGGFAFDTCLLHNIFPTAQIEITPDRRKLSTYTLSDIDTFSEELRLLNEIAPPSGAWLSVLGAYRNKCDADVMRYEIATKCFVRSCPIEQHDEDGCCYFKHHMKPNVFKAYEEAVSKFTGGDEF